MTESEARTVAALLASADGWCGNCGAKLARQAAVDFPRWPWVQWVDEFYEGYDKQTPHDQRWATHVVR